MATSRRSSRRRTGAAGGSAARRYRAGANRRQVLHHQRGRCRRANDANSYRDYAAGSATAEYRQMVDQAAAIAKRQKERVDPMYHEKIDALLDTYAASWRKT